MYSYEDVVKSKTLLGLRERATLKEIKHNYKTLMRKWHPDKHADAEQATRMSAQINKAYEIIMDYLEHYEYELDEAAIKKRTQTPQEWWHERFYAK